MKHSDDNTGGEHFKPKSLAFATTKSVALASTLSAAAFYAVLGVMGRSLKPSSELLSWSLVGGAAAGAFFGHDQYDKTKIYNNKAETLNKYQSNPQMQNAILDEIGGTGFEFKRGTTEAFLGNVNTASLISWVGYGLVDKRQPPPTISKVLGATTILSGFGWVAAHILGTDREVKTEKKNVLYAEKIALDRASSKISSDMAR